MGPRVSMIRPRACVGGVKSVGAVDDEPDTAVEAFVSGVGDAQVDRGEDPARRFRDGASQGDEGREAAAAGCPGAEPIEQDTDVGFVQISGEHCAQRFLEGPTATPPPTHTHAGRPGFNIPTRAGGIGDPFAVLTGRRAPCRRLCLRRRPVNRLNGLCQDTITACNCVNESTPALLPRNPSWVDLTT